MQLEILPQQFAVCKLTSMPAAEPGGSFYFFAKTDSEFSLVCEESYLPPNVRACEKGWRCLRFCYELPFSMTGVLAALTKPLAQAKISVFAVSTYDTDYLLIKEQDVPRAQQILLQSSYTFLEAKERT